MFDGLDSFDGHPERNDPPREDDLAAAIGTGLAVAVVAGCLWLSYVAWHVAITVGLP